MCPIKIEQVLDHQRTELIKQIIIIRRGFFGAEAGHLLRDQVIADGAPCLLVLT